MRAWGWSRRATSRHGRDGCMHAALLVARHLPHAEIIDYASAGKADAPSGTARELAERLAGRAPPRMPGPATDVSVRPRQGRRRRRDAGPLAAPAELSVSTEIVFGLPDERLSIRHDAGSSAEPYVAGTLLAIRRVGDVVGLVRGLDTLLLGQAGGWGPRSSRLAPAGGPRVHPDVVLGRRDAERREDRADLTSVVGAIVQDLGQANARRRARGPATVLFDDLLVRVKVTLEQRKPRRSHRHECERSSAAPVSASSSIDVCSTGKKD